MSAKKKRMGSHRRSNQSKMDTDSLRIEGGASAAELMQTEKSEADLQASPDYSQSETQHSPPSEMTGHRRKLGSSRSKKGRQHVKDSIIESDHKPTEEDAKNNETLEIKMSVETPRHRNLNDQSERDGDGSLFSMPLPNVMDVLISKSENQQEAPNERQTDFGLLSDLCKLEEAKLEGIDESLTRESGDVTSESAHYVDISTFHTSPAISQSTVMEMTDNASSVYSLTEKQNRERDDEDLVRQDEQSELINLSQVDETKQSDDDLTEREAEAAQMQDVQHILVSSESVTNENTSDTSVKLTDQLERHWVYRDEDHLEDDIKPTAERTVHHDMKDLLSENSGNESYLQTLYTEMNAPLASQHQDILEKPTDTDFHPIVSRRKLGSSRRNKGRHHVKDSAAESQNQNEEGVKEKIDDETGGATEISSSVEVVMQEKTAETVVEGMDTSEVITDEVKDDAPLVDISEFIHLNVQEETGTVKQDGNVQNTDLVQEPHIKSEEKESPRVEITIENISPEENTKQESNVKGPTVDQQLIDQSKSTEMEQELHSVDSAPVRSRREEETGTAKQDGNVQTTDLVQEPHIKSEKKESPRVEITIENISSEENIKQESHVKGPIVDQQLTDQSKSTEMEQEGLHSVDSATDPQYKEKHEETEVSIHGGDFYAINVKSESPVKSEEKESPKVEITIENISSEENTKQESNVNEAFVSLQKEVTTNEQQHRLLSISGLTVPHNLEDKVSEVDEEIKTTLQNTQSEMHIQLDPQPLEDPQNIHSEQTQTSVETIEDGGIKKLVEVREHYNAEAEGSMNVNVPGLQHGAPAVKETHALDEFAYTELFPVPRNETQTEARLDTFLEETTRAEASTEESSMSEAVGECKGTPAVDQSENVQIKPQQKRRKMGSTRRAPMHRKQEEENETGAGNFHTDIGVRDHEKRNVLEAIPGMLVEKVNENEKPLQSETQKESDALEEERKTPSNAAIDLMAAIPLQVEPHGEAVVNPVMFANAASACDSEKNEGVIFNTSQPVDFARAEIHVPFVVAKNSSLSMNQLLPTDTENAGLASVYEMSLSTQNDDGLSESLRKKESEDSNELKALTSAESPAPEIVKEDAGEGDNNTLDNMREQNILHEGASNTSTETKNESPDLNLTKKRRKMGSTRKSLGTRPKREDLNEKQADDTEDAETTGNAGDVTTQSVCDVREKEPQLQTEHEDGDSGQGTEKGFETVDFSNIGDTCKTSAPQQLDDENPVSQRSLEESDQLISGDLSEIPAASSNLDAMSDSAAGRRRRKMGSHRSSRGAQTTKQGEITDTQNGSDARIVTDESAMKTAETRLDQIREVNDTNPFSISTSRTVSEKPSEPVTPAQHLYPDVQLDQERQRKLSLGYTRRANPSDIMYDVVMIGDSCVGKTSFMKRAQSGKFSLDLPASVGLDSCIWKVIVDGKPVVLHLWDTAGQERFRSLTRQTFYKAQAFLLMYDVSSVESFSAVNYWVNCIKEGAAEDVIVLLLGNKCDHTKRQVKIQQGESLAKEYNFDFMECSAATGENVIESLEIVARLLGQKAVPTEETLVLLQESKPKNKSGCC